MCPLRVPGTSLVRLLATGVLDVGHVQMTPFRCAVTSREVKR